jgi:hypothetical protein
MVGIVNPGVWRSKKTDREFKYQPPYYNKGYGFIVECFGNTIHLFEFKMFANVFVYGFVACLGY